MVVDKVPDKKKGGLLISQSHFMFLNWVVVDTHFIVDSASSILNIGTKISTCSSICCNN